MKPWINFPRSQGRFSRQAHCDLPDGSYEREVGREGFYGPATHFYHRHPPTDWLSFEGELRPRAFDANKLAAPQACPWQAAKLLSNTHCQIRFWAIDQPMTELARNADGDELLFVHVGSGELFCDYGHLHYQQGDYLLLPRGTMWRVEPDAHSELLMIEATGGQYQLPERGLLGAHAQFDPAMLDSPEINPRFVAQQTEEPWAVVVKRGDSLSRIHFAYNPLDAIGWKGELSVLRINWRDIRPVVSPRYHLPPSAHSSFIAERFVVCSFCPRPSEAADDALNLPFYHSNEDYEEVIFYHQGDFVSRDNIHPGMLSYHPYGFTHGPHPGALKAASERRGQARALEEMAVMVDCRDALRVSEAAEGVEWSAYVDSWGAPARR